MSVYQLTASIGHFMSVDQVARPIGQFMSFDYWSSLQHQHGSLWSELVDHAVLQSFIHLKAIVIAMLYRP